MGNPTAAQAQYGKVTPKVIHTIPPVTTTINPSDTPSQGTTIQTTANGPTQDTLPFTGVNLGLIGAIGLVLIIVGIELHRRFKGKKG